MKRWGQEGKEGRMVKIGNKKRPREDRDFFR